MNKKSLFSAVGLLAIAVVLVVSVAVINALPGWRVDLTEDELFTLSDGTRSIVGNLEEPLELLFFYSDSATQDAPQIRSYATRVEELLNEIDNLTEELKAWQVQFGDTAVGQKWLGKGIWAPRLILLGFGKYAMDG